MSTPIASTPTRRAAMLMAAGVATSVVESSPANGATEKKTLEALPEVRAAEMATVDSVAFNPDAPGALRIVDTVGTNGRRLSIQPIDITGTTSSQLELVPAANVSPGEITAQIQLFNKTGANFERFVISAYNGEYQFHSSRSGTGVARPTFFYVDNEKAWAVMRDATFRVYQGQTFGNDGDVNLTRPAAKTLQTNGTFIAQGAIRAAEGTPSQVRIGNTAGLGLPTISMGTDGKVQIVRNASRVEVRGAGFRIIGGFGANGATPAGKQKLPAAANSAATVQALVNAMRSALITFGLAQ